MTLIKMVVATIALTMATVVQAATITVCDTNSVTLEGVAADSCYGMFEGNFNSLSDINTAAGTSFVDYDTTSITTLQNAFSLGSNYGPVIGIALKQNTSWGIWLFDLLSRDIGANGVWDAAWDTSFTSWDGNPDVEGCQGCGGLSHGAIAYTGEVPVPGTMGLLGIGLLGLGLVRRKAIASL